MGKVAFSIELSDEQKEGKLTILNHPYNFILGDPGTGKTLLAIQVALDMFFKGEVSKIVITRPTISSEDNGFLPGSLAEKYEPWLAPIRDNIGKVYNRKEKIQKMFANKDIEIVSLSHFRGITFSRSACIVDEFQNLSGEQLSMCVGRLGKDSTMIFSGDKRQIDLRNKKDSAVHKVELLNECPYVGIINLVENHRHPALREILKLLY